MKTLLIVPMLIFYTLLASADVRPKGVFLFQPQLEWANGKITQQGTGFLLRDGTRSFGITSMHFMDFQAGGLKRANWLDLKSGKTFVSFKRSLGTPGAKGLNFYVDLKHDFVVFPMSKGVKTATLLELENVKEYTPGMLLWFPYRTDVESGFEWLPAIIMADEGFAIRVSLFGDGLRLMGRSGSPFINQLTGKVVGLLSISEGEGADQVILLAPTRHLDTFLKKNTETLPLLKSIRDD